EAMTRRALADAGLADRVTVSSVGTGDWHAGDGMDPRAAAELEASGLDSAHTAAQLATADHSADLLVALDRRHRGQPPARAAGAPAADPYSGARDGFPRTRSEIAAALPGLVSTVRDLLG